MLETVISGISLGLVLAMLVGPVFFMILVISIRQGFRSAAWFVTGVALNDAFYILVTYLSSSALMLFRNYTMEIGVVGGLVLIAFGLANALKKPAVQATDLELGETTSGWINLVKGFMMNLLNPFVLIFWFGVSGAAGYSRGDSAASVTIFYSATLATIFLTDLIKAWLARRLRDLLRPPVLLWLNRISGMALILFGLRLCIQSLGVSLF